eukprot:3057163-Prymnesium_polylepis.1
MGASVTVMDKAALAALALCRALATLSDTEEMCATTDLYFSLPPEPFALVAKSAAAASATIVFHGQAHLVRGDAGELRHARLEVVVHKGARVERRGARGMNNRSDVANVGRRWRCGRGRGKGFLRAQAAADPHPRRARAGRLGQAAVALVGATHIVAAMMKRARVDARAIVVASTS